MCNDISTFEYGYWIRELKDKGVHLSDTRESGLIEVLLEKADVAGRKMLLINQSQQVKYN